MSRIYPDVTFEPKSRAVQRPVSPLVTKMKVANKKIRGCKDFHCMVGGYPFTISFFTMQSSPLWENKDVLFTLCETSEGIWKAMTPEQREVLKNKIRQALGVMHDEIDQWIPDALSMDEVGQTIRIEVNFLAAELEKEVRLLDQVTSFQIKQAAEQAEKIARELSIGSS